MNDRDTTEIKEEKRAGGGLIREVFLPFALAAVLTECVSIAAGAALDVLAARNEAAAVYFLRWPGDRNLAALAAGMAALLLYSARPARPEIAHVQGTRGTLGQPEDFALMILVSICAALAVNGAVSLFGGLPGSIFGEAAGGYGAAAAREGGSMPGMHLVPGFAVYAFLSPLAEEALFRGVLFVRLGRRTSFAGAAFLSAAMFSLWHGTGPSAVYALIMGVLFCAAFALTRRFAAAVAMHGAANAAVFLLYVVMGLSDALSRPWMIALFALGAAMGVFLIRERMKKEEKP